MAVRLSALRAGNSLRPGRFLVLVSVRGRVDPRVILRLEGLDQLKNQMTTLGIDPTTFRLVVQCPSFPQKIVHLRNHKRLPLDWENCRTDFEIAVKVKELHQSARIYLTLSSTMCGNKHDSPALSVRN
jgi:hypothetical protein